MGSISANGGDALSDVLRLLRLKGCVYFLSEFHSPWGMQMGSGPVASFHLVVRGKCSLRLEDRQIALAGGDIVVLPHGDAHALSDAAETPQSRHLPGREVLQAVLSGDPPFAAGSEATTLLCGHFEYDRDLNHPLIAELPPVIHLHAMAQTQPAWLESVTPLLIRETASPSPGSESMVDRLAEVLLIQILRIHLLQEPPERGYLAALGDHQISRALRIMHAQADAELSLASLARAIGMSRSSLATRFKACLGVAPMTYLTNWRMLIAGQLLKSSQKPLVEVAEAVGYGSEAAFSRAFKRTYEQSPSAYRSART